MKKAALMFSIFSIAGAFVSAQTMVKSQCDSYARSIMKPMFKSDLHQFIILIEVKAMKIRDVPSNQNIQIERLIYASDGASVTVDTLPNYYQKGECELSSLKIVRE